MHIYTMSYIIIDWYTYIYIYIHTYIHIYIYACMLDLHASTIFYLSVYFLCLLSSSPGVGRSVQLPLKHPAAWLLDGNILTNSWWQGAIQMDWLKNVMNFNDWPIPCIHSVWQTLMWLIGFIHSKLWWFSNLN